MRLEASCELVEGQSALAGEKGGPWLAAGDAISRGHDRYPSPEIATGAAQVKVVVEASTAATSRSSSKMRGGFSRRTLKSDGCDAREPRARVSSASVALPRP